MKSLIDSTVFEVLDMTWPTLLIALVLVVTIRVGYLLKHPDEFVFYKEMLYLVFMLYILCLFQLVTEEDVNTLTSNNNFKPFTEMFRYSFGSRLFFRNIVGNVLMFVPYGFFSSLYIRLKSPLRAFILVLFASIAIELTQLGIGRCFDVDDIILNVVGGMLGYLIYYAFDRLSDTFTVLKKEIVLNILTCIVLSFFIAFIIWR